MYHLPLRQLSFLLLLVLPHPLVLASELTRPNILLLVAEDLSPRLKALGDASAVTPNLDALANQSLRYSRVFTTAGVCAPSRAALIMGQHQISFAAQHMRTTTGPLGEYRALPNEVLKAFPEYLREEGYYTFTDSKLDYQFSGVRAGSGPFTIWDAQGAGADWTGRTEKQPFFGLINFMQTHESRVMRTQGEPVSPSHKASIAMRKSLGLVAPTRTDPASLSLPPYYPDLPEVRADLARHYDNIAAMDAQVGAILQRLEAEGLRKQTIVIWTTDHGDGLPRAKRELFDSGIHVPLILSQPQDSARGRAGQVDDRLVSFVDLAPTILALASVELPQLQAAALQGVNFLQSNRQAIYASRDRIDEVMDRQRAIRNHRYKYILSYHPEVAGGHPLGYRDNLDMVRAMRAAYVAGELTAHQARWFQPVGREQLYDLATDPHELENLLASAPTPEVRAIADGLAQQLQAHLSRVGDTANEPEHDMRNRLLIGGQVPVTAAPEVKLQGELVSASAEAGASIGYRQSGDGESWKLYTAPIRRNKGEILEFKAVRYGWRESSVVQLGH